MKRINSRTACVLVWTRWFAAEAQHAMRTPLAGLRAELEEARLHPQQTDLATLLECALRDVDRLEAVINDLLLLAKVATGAPVEHETVDLTDVVRAAVYHNPGDVDVELRLDPGLTVSAVPTQLNRLVIGLLDNARLHARDTVHVRARRRGDAVELVVADDQTEVQRPGHTRIRDRNARLNDAPVPLRDHDGAGFGLAVAREIALAHSGTLQDAGGGRTVFRLPMAS